MTDDAFTPKRLLALRKLTRAVADLLREQAARHVAVLAPLLRPATVLGEYAAGAARDANPVAERGLKDLQALYEQVAVGKPFTLSKTLKLPLEVVGSEVELSPLEYTHVAGTGPDAKPIRITSPLKWAVSYAGFAPGRLSTVGFSPRRLKEQLTTGSRSAADLQQFVVHFLAVHLAAKQAEGVAGILRDLRFPIETARVPDFGELPVTCVASVVRTVRPPDDVLLEHTEIAGTDAFEEVVDVEGILGLTDPTREHLADLARAHGVAPAPPA